MQALTRITRAARKAVAPATALLHKLYCRHFGYVVVTQTQQGAFWVRYTTNFTQALHTVSLHAKVSVASTVLRKGDVVAQARKVQPVCVVPVCNKLTNIACQV